LFCFGFFSSDVENDPALELKCFELCQELLNHGGVPDLKKKKAEELTAEDWKREEYYFVQYAAAQALGLLLRSNPGTLLITLWNLIGGEKDEF